MIRPEKAAKTPKAPRQWPHFADDAKYRIGEIAELLKITDVDTLHRYLRIARQRRAAGDTSPSLMPEPDGHEELSGIAFWYGRTINAWLAARRGSGWWGDNQDPRRRGRAAPTDPDQEKS